jgi:hypothetical protein
MLFLTTSVVIWQISCDNNHAAHIWCDYSSDYNLDQRRNNLFAAKSSLLDQMTFLWKELGLME